MRYFTGSRWWYDNICKCFQFCSSLLGSCCIFSKYQMWWKEKQLFFYSTPIALNLVAYSSVVFAIWFISILIEQCVLIPSRFPFQKALCYRNYMNLQSRLVRNQPLLHPVLCIILIDICDALSLGSKIIPSRRLVLLTHFYQPRLVIWALYRRKKAGLGSNLTVWSHFITQLNDCVCVIS